MNYLPYIITLALGLLVTLQAGINAQLKESLHQPTTATFVSFVVGLVAIIGYGMIIRTPLPTYSQIVQTPWWQWTGGILGAVYVLGTIILVQKIGAAPMLGLLITSQIISALVFDHYGWLGFPLSAISWGKAIGAILMVGGVYLIVKH